MSSAPSSRREPRSQLEFIRSGLMAQPATREYASLEEMRADLESMEVGPGSGHAPRSEGSETVPARSETGTLGARRSINREEPKTLNLSAVLKDVAIRNKYQISARMVHAWKERQRKDVQGVLRDIKEHLDSHGFVNTSVRLDSTRNIYGESRDALQDAGEALPWPVEPVDIQAIPPFPNTFIISPRFADDDWEISSRDTSLALALIVWKLCCAWGPRRVAEQFADELMSVHVAITTRSGRDYATFYEGHIGGPVGVEVESLTNLGYEPMATDDATMYAGSLALVERDGVPCATAVSVAPHVWLINDHVREAADDTTVFLGKSLTKHSFVRAYGSQWLVVTYGSEKATQVLFRSPAPAERVNLVYWTGGRWYRSPLGVMTDDGTRHVVRSERGHDFPVTLGMSGSMYVAEADGAVVATHEGFSDTVGSIVLPIDSALLAARIGGLRPGDVVNKYYASSPDSVKVLNSTVAGMKRDKLRASRFDNIVAYLGVDAGYTTLRTSVGTLSVMPGDGGLVTRSSPELVSFNPFGLRLVDDGVNICDFATRPPEGDEAVVAVGKDELGPYVTDAFNLRMSDTGPQFTVPVDGENLVSCRGSVLVAVADASIVGWLLDSSASLSDGTMRRMCVGVRRVQRSVHGSSETTDPPSDDRMADTFNEVLRITVIEPSVASIVSRLQSLYPYLKSAAYEPHLVEEAFTHSSRGNYDLGERRAFSANRYLSRMGDAVMSARLQWDMRAKQIPDAAATILKSQIQTNNRQAAIIGKTRLHECYRGGANPPIIGVHAMADLLEALAALVYLHEDNSVLDRFLNDVGMMAGDPT